jgi:hypothetical protein
MENNPAPDTVTPAPSPAPASPPANYVLPPHASVTDLRDDMSYMQSMNLVFGGAILVLTIVVTGIICYLGGIQVPYISAYFSSAEPSTATVESARRVPVVHTSAMATSSMSATASTSAMMASTTKP